MQTHLFIQSEESPPAYLSEEYILSIKKSLDAKRRLLEKLPAEIADLSKRFDAAMLFAPPDFDPDKAQENPLETIRVVRLEPSVKPAIRKREMRPVTPAKPEKPIGWRKGLQALLDDANEGMHHQQLLKSARDKYKFPESVGEKGFYNAIAKLINAGTVIKHGNILYAVSVFKQKQEADELPRVPETQRRNGSSAELIRKLLLTRPDGLTGPELRKILSAMPDAPKSLREHGQYVYNILGTMMGIGEVVKENRIYRLTVEGGNER